METADIKSMTLEEVSGMLEELDEVMEEALELQEEMQDVQQEMTQENLRKEAAVNAQKAAGEEADLQEAVVYHPFDIKV